MTIECEKSLVIPGPRAARNPESVWVRDETDSGFRRRWSLRRPRNDKYERTGR